MEKIYVVTVQQRENINRNPDLYITCYSEKHAFFMVRHYNRDEKKLACVMEFSDKKQFYLFAWSLARSLSSDIVNKRYKEQGKTLGDTCNEFWAIVNGAKNILGEKFYNMCREMFYTRLDLQ